MYCKTGPAIGPVGRRHLHNVDCAITPAGMTGRGHTHALAGCCESCDHGGTCESKLATKARAMGYLPTGASIGPEGGLLAPSTQTYQREGAPGRLALQTEIYTLGYTDMRVAADPEFARRSQQLNVHGGQDWLLDADRRYHTSLEGFVADNKNVIVLGLLGIAALVLIKGDFLKPKRRNPKKRKNGGSKNFKVEVYGGPGGKFTSYWGSRQAAAKEASDIRKMPGTRARMFSKRGGRWA